MAIYLGDQIVGLGSFSSESNSSSITLSTLSAVANTTYTAPNGTAYSSVNVNVPQTLKMGLMRTDPVLIQSYSKDSLFMTDENGSIPEGTYTTDKTLIAAQQLTPTISLDYNYNYYVLERFLTIPIYNVTTKGKGRFEYHTSSYLYELCDCEPNLFKAILDDTRCASRNIPVCVCGAVRSPYWSSTSTLSLYTSVSYGTAQGVVAPAISSGVLTISAPKLSIRGHATYLSSTYYDAITDIRRQYVIEVYRVPKGNLNLNGWGVYQQFQHICDNITNNNCKLT